MDNLKKENEQVNILMFKLEYPIDLNYIGLD